MYGTENLEVTIPGSNVTVIQPRHLPGLERKRGIL